MTIEEVIRYIEEHLWMRKLLISIVTLLIIMLLVKFISSVLFNYMSDNNKFHITKKRVYYGFSIFYIIIMLFIWLEMAGFFTTYMGLVSAGVAIALKDIFSNMAGWLFIILRKPFSVGDRILIHGQRGDVIDVRIFQFSLIELSAPEDGEQSTGRIVDIPNHYIFLYPVVNYVKGFKYIWNEIPIEITFESNWQKAKLEFEEIVKKHALHFTDQAQEEVEKAARQYMIYYGSYTPIVYTDVRSSGVLLTIRYLCSPKAKRNTVNDIWEDVLQVIEKNADIDLAYPTKRVVQ